MRLIVVSGLSGSGKSVALDMLEDLDFYCVDNIPAGLLHGFIAYTVRTSETPYRQTAVGLDVRNRPEDLAEVPRLVLSLRKSGIGCEMLFLRADNETLLKRFSETRRRHPLSRAGMGLQEALEQERRLLAPLNNAADLTIDTSRLSVHELREVIRERVVEKRHARPVAAVPVVRLSSRRAGRCRFRVRCACAAQPVLGAVVARIDRTRRGRCQPSSTARKKSAVSSRT